MSAAACLLGAAPAWCAPPEPAPANTTTPRQTDAVTPADPFALTVYWENDGTILKRNNPRDRHYTNGLAITFAHQPGWAGRLAAHLPFADRFGPADTAVGYGVGHLIFTPEDINSTTPILDDQPYAGYLFGGAYLQRSRDAGERGPATLEHLQLDLGVVGPSAAGEDVQNFVHEAVDIPEARGWDNQLSDEPTVQFFLRKKWRLDLLGPASDTADPLLTHGRLQVQLIPAVHGALGSVFRNVEAHGTLRLGVNLPDDFGPGRLADYADATGARRAGWGGYIFGRLAGRLVEHNLFFEGGTFEDGPGVDAKRFVGEAQLGIVGYYQWGAWGVELGYAQTFLTREFDEQTSGDAFGALTLAVRGTF